MVDRLTFFAAGFATAAALASLYQSRLIAGLHQSFQALSQSLVEPIRDLQTRLDTVEQRLEALTTSEGRASQGNNNESDAKTGKVANSVGGDPKSWSVDQVAGWLQSVLRMEKIDQASIAKVLETFSEVNGIELHDLVTDESHGLHISHKLQFMGVEGDVVGLLSPLMTGLFA